MGRFGGYYKGEKKKAKKTAQKSGAFPPPLAGSASIFKMPEIISRGKKGG